MRLGAWALSLGPTLSSRVGGVAGVGVGVVGVSYGRRPPPPAAMHDGDHADRNRIL